MTPPVTQIHYLTVGEDKDLSDKGSEGGKPWSRALDLLENSAGFRRVYWGRSPEDETKVQLHVGKRTLPNPESSDITYVLGLCEKPCDYEERFYIASC